MMGIVESAISIHAPREGGDYQLQEEGFDFPGHFNPRPPRGGRPSPVEWDNIRQYISIHAPREGGDPRSGKSSSATI